MNTTQRLADHLPGGRQERSESANALERRFVAQVHVLGYGYRRTDPIRVLCFSWFIHLIFKIRKPSSSVEGLGKPVCQQTSVAAYGISWVLKKYMIFWV